MDNPVLKKLSSLNSLQIFLAILVAAVVLGTASGYILASSGSKISGKIDSVSSQVPKSALADTRTFRDFAEGMIQKRPPSQVNEEYAEGTHLLVRLGGVPVALTSSVVDLSQYEGKKVKVFGETQKAIKEGWLMDVGKVELER